MCGIVGYIGDKQALPIVIKGLERLEYRGYDSAGILIYDQRKKEVYFEKQPGRIKNLTRVIDPDTPGTLGIGHTRWATHGQVNKANAHPHYDCQKKIFVVHNGIIENFREIKSSLIQRGHKFSSETDTEVFPHLLEELIKEGLSYEQAIIQSLKKIRGSFAFLIFNKDYPDMIVAARLSSPLILGLGDKEFILASDQTAIGLITNKIVYLNDGDIVFVNKNKYEIKSFLSEDTKNYEGIIDFSSAETEKGRFQNYMIKEIFDEPKAVEDTLRGRLLIEEGDVKLGGLDRVASRLKEIDNILITGCGTAFYAAKLAEYFFEEYAQISTKAEIASELRYKMPVVSEKTLLISVSQSGETADTLAALREMKKKGILTIGITNVVGSTQSRETDAGVYTRSGPEIAVASTKAFLGQLATLAMLTIYLGRQSEMSLVTGKRIIEELAKLQELAREVLKKAPEIEKLAKKYRNFKNFWFIGRKYNFPIALEGALKLKEISYLHAEGIAGGELKHGPLALIDENFPTIAICPSDSVYEKMISNIQEIKAREGPVIAIATQGNEEIKKIVDDVIYIPKTLEMLTPLLSIIPLHLFAYYMAVLLGNDVDKPRNLAKVITVE